MEIYNKRKKGGCKMAVAILGQAVLGEMILGNDGSGIEWKKPKTDWKSSDRFNIVDFNRIKTIYVFCIKKHASYIVILI